MLCVGTGGAAELCHLAKKRASASSQRPPFSHAAMAALHLMTSGGNPRVFIFLISACASTQRPSFALALIVL
jgi:hypothetical protein